MVIQNFENGIKFGRDLTSSVSFGKLWFFFTKFPHFENVIKYYGDYFKDVIK